MNAPANTTSMRELRAPTPAIESDQAVDLFTARGFALAQRIATAFAESSAVPAVFRRWSEKKGQGGVVTWVENTAAMSNCLVAIETARSVGMSITAVMQQANVIEGKLTWSAQFTIAAVNASRRFTPLRFDMQQRGPMKATYQQKLGWNKDKKGFDFAERAVDIDNVVCIAWALPFGMEMPKGVYSLDQARNAGLPIIESAPVSMKMAVEEGWYAKAGSKWQTEMRTLMLTYRAGAFFGRVHAPDVVMGMGRTTEEYQDMTTIDVAPDGSVTSVTREDILRPASPPPPAEVVSQVNTLGDQQHDEPTGEVDPPAPAAAHADAPRTFDAIAFGDRLEACTSVDTLDVMADEIRSLANDEEATLLNEIYRHRREQLMNGKQPAPKAAASRRTSSQSGSQPE